MVAEPTALIAYDTQKILVRSDDHTGPGFGKAQWRDTIPKLLQAKITQSFENAGFLDQVSRPMEGMNADRQLVIDIRRFEIVSAEKASAEIAFTARIMSGDGRIIAARFFQATAPGSTSDVKLAVAGLNQAFDKAVGDLVPWTAGNLGRS